MRFFCLAVLLLAVAVFAPHAHAQQLGIYGEFSETIMTNPLDTNHLAGATAGLVAERNPILHGHLVLAGDIHGRFVHATNFDYDGIVVGPRAYIPLAWGLRPYAEFAIGLARIHSLSDQSDPTTDGTIEVNAGVAKKMSSHLDLTADYSYAQYYAFGGEYNPKTFSIGAIFYFKKR